MEGNDLKSVEENDDDVELDAFNVEIENAFVGRDTELDDLKKSWRTHKVFGLFGIRSVGKSRLVNEFLKTFKPRPFELLKVNVGIIKDSTKLYTNLCAILKQKPDLEALESDAWMNDIADYINGFSRKPVVIVFDNTEDCQDLQGPEARDSFLSLVSCLAKHCPDIKIFVTSTTRVQLSQLRNVYFSLELKPLQTVHARKLLRLVSDRSDLGDSEDKIVELSEGLPLLLLMIGSELREDKGMISPEDMVSFLATRRLKALSREFYPPDDRVDHVYKKFIDRIEAVYRNSLTSLEYIPGTFTAEQARDLLGYDSVAIAKDEVLIYHRRRHMIDYDPETKRFNIQGILRECLSTFYTISNLSDVRQKYCQTFSKVMKNISSRMGTVEYTKALSEFSVEQPNLQKLLTEVQYTSQDTYRFFIEMATVCTELIERFMAGDSDEFYQCCLKATELYGQEMDRAAVNLAVGSMYTNTKGDLVRGERNYNSALSVLERNGHSLQLATCYQRLGWNVLQQARNTEAISYFQKSLAISTVSGEEYDLINLQSLSSMGVTLVVLGNFDDAKRYHFACLERRKRIQGENHPSIGSTLNNIGIMYDQMEDHENALVYYRRGLELKKRSNAPIPALVFSLTNTASTCLKLGNFREAHELLDEALSKVNDQAVVNKEVLANIYDTKGTTYFREKKYESAAKMYKNALELREEIAAHNMPYMESLVHLARVNKCLGNEKESLKLSKKALKMKDKAIVAMPQNGFISECLDIVADIYKIKETCIDKYRDTLIKIEFELLRLESVYAKQGNAHGMARIRNKMIKVKETLTELKGDEE